MLFSLTASLALLIVSQAPSSDDLIKPQKYNLIKPPNNPEYEFDLAKAPLKYRKELTEARNLARQNLSKMQAECGCTLKDDSHWGNSLDLYGVDEQQTSLESLRESVTGCSERI
jgi:hypothetical protein